MEWSLEVGKNEQPMAVWVSHNRMDAHDAKIATEDFVPTKPQSSNTVQKNYQDSYWVKEKLFYSSLGTENGITLNVQISTLWLSRSFWALDVIWILNTWIKTYNLKNLSWILYINILNVGKWLPFYTDPINSFWIPHLALVCPLFKPLPFIFV